MDEKVLLGLAGAVFLLMLSIISYFINAIHEDFQRVKKELQDTRHSMKNDIHLLGLKVAKLEVKIDSGNHRHASGG